MEGIFRIVNWYTSDWHLGHANVIKYSKRPFRDVDEMDESIVSNFNEKVRPGDCVYLLGDFSFYKKERTEEFCKKINSKRVHLILGNHDKLIRNDKYLQSLFATVSDYKEVKENDLDAHGFKRKLVLSHYPFLTWNQSHRGSYSLHGHCHNSLTYDGKALRVDVGVDGWDYFPVNYEQVKEYMSHKTFVPIDHHGREDED